MLPRARAAAQAICFPALAAVLGATAHHLQIWHALAPFHQEHVLPLVVLVSCLRVSAPGIAMTAGCVFVLAMQHVRLAEGTIDPALPNATTTPSMTLLAAASVPLAYPLVALFTGALLALLGRLTLGLGPSTYARAVALDDVIYGLGSSVVFGLAPAALLLLGRRLWAAPISLLRKLLYVQALLVALSATVQLVLA